MAGPSAADVAGRAREAAARGEWEAAYALLAAADGDGRLGAAELPALADAAYASGHLDATIEAWERAYAAAREAGDPIGAAGAAVRVAMHLVFDTALLAPVRGWLARADRLLDGRDATPAHAWRAVVRAYERLLSGDFAGAREWAGRAVEDGVAHDRGAAALGRVAQARSLILEGQVAEGLALLDEAAVATVSGEVDPLTTGVVYCEVVCALQALAQYDLAEEWTAAMERWCRGHSVGSVHGRCRVHRAEILRLRGASREAEAEAEAACDELRPYLRRELGWPLAELGRIRLRMGDVPGAERALLEAHARGWDPQPGLALVRLAQGDAARAAACIRDALAHPMDVPSKELPPHTDLRRAPLLEAAVEIEIAAGDPGRAREAADELAAVAERFGSAALLAGAAHARGRVSRAEGDLPGARAAFETAVRLWSEVGAPYETGLARAGLAGVHDAAGNAQGALLERDAAVEALTRAGAGHLVDGLLRPGDGAGAPPGQRAPGAVPSFRREGDVWALSFDGLTVRVRDLKGLGYLARLLAEPGHELHALDLVALESAPGADARPAREVGLSAPGDAGPLLDARAKEAYRRRLAEVEEDMREARAMGDPERAARADAERDVLVRELSRALGLGGRDRVAGSDSERARASVTRAIRQAIARIRPHHPDLADHLDRSVRTGTRCLYR